MKINIDVQVLCCDPSEYRGIPYYTIELIRALVYRGNNQYSISFFDYGKERGNRKYVEKALADVIDRLEIHECNSLDYRKVLEGTKIGNSSSYDAIGYDDYVDCDSDVFFFPHGSIIPWNVPYDKTIVTVHDTIPIIESVNDRIPEDEKASFRNSMNYISDRSDITLITDSESSKKDLVNRIGIDRERISVIPCAYNPNMFYSDMNMELTKKWGINNRFILFVGALAPHKGIDTFIEALEMISAKHHEVDVVIAGRPTPQIDVRDMISKTKTQNRIILTGYVTDEEKRVLLSMAELFVFPSNYEGFGLPVLEAMACGTAVITSRVSSIPEVAGDSVYYIEPGDKKALAEAIDLLLSDTSLRERFRSKGIAQCSKFSWDRTAEEFERICDRYYAE